jgi:hypothetical protein
LSSGNGIYWQKYFQAFGNSFDGGGIIWLSKFSKYFPKKALTVTDLKPLEFFQAKLFSFQNIFRKKALTIGNFSTRLGAWGGENAALRFGQLLYKKH